MVKIKTLAGVEFEIAGFNEISACHACGGNTKHINKWYCKECAKMRHTEHLHLTCRCGFKWEELTKREHLRMVHEAMQRPPEKKAT